MKYIDTTVFVQAIRGIDEARSLLVDIASGKVEACTSVLTWDEFVWVLKRQLKDDALAREEGEKLLRFPHLHFADVTLDLLIRAQTLMVDNAMRPRDAIHAATAISRGIKEIFTDDSDFDRIPGLTRRSLSKQLL